MNNVIGNIIYMPRLDEFRRPSPCPLSHLLPIQPRAWLSGAERRRVREERRKGRRMQQEVSRSRDENSVRLLDAGRHCVHGGNDLRCRHANSIVSHYGHPASFIRLINEARTARSRADHAGLRCLLLVVIVEPLRRGREGGAVDSQHEAAAVVRPTAPAEQQRSSQSKQNAN